MKTKKKNPTCPKCELYQGASCPTCNHDYAAKMEAAKPTHTPGPWTISKANSGRLVVGNRSDGKDWASVASLRNLAVDGTETTERDTFGKLRIKKHAQATVEANARLIAAAPDLLAALKLSLLALERHIKFASSPDGKNYLHTREIEAARAAIAKAQEAR